MNQRNPSNNKKSRSVRDCAWRPKTWRCQLTYSAWRNLEKSTNQNHQTMRNLETRSTLWSATVARSMLWSARDQMVWWFDQMRKRESKVRVRATNNKEREKITKILNASATVIVCIYTITVTIVYLCTIYTNWCECFFSQNV